MKKLHLNKKRAKKSLSSLAEIVTYGFSIGAGALIGLMTGGTIWLCIGSLLGLGVGFLLESGLLNNTFLTKAKK